VFDESAGYTHSIIKSNPYLNAIQKNKYKHRLMTQYNPSTNTKLNGLVNTRGVSDNIQDMKRTNLEYIRLNKTDYDNGFKIGPTTLGFRDNETKYLRMTNEYKFGSIKLVMVWSNEVRLMTNPPSTMLVHPKLLSIRLTDSDRLINSELPPRLLDDIINVINETIGALSYRTSYIDVDQIEGLPKLGVLKRPDLLLERLVGLAETRTAQSRDQLQYSRMIPDDLNLIVSIERVVDR
jgi:hypothetical protein